MRRLVSELRLPRVAARIAIKLNLCDYRRPETGAVSDPEMVAALLQILTERYPNAQLYLCENDASDTLVRNIWGYLGLDRVARKYGASLCSLSTEPWHRVPLPGSTATIEVPTIFAECDLLINHPKLKTHGKTMITCGLKNLFGCYRSKDKRPLHRDLTRAIVDINRVIRPHFTIVDADLCVEGNRGPTQGLPKRLGFLFGGIDPVAVDAFCATLMGFRPSRVGHIRGAARAGIGGLAYEIEGDLRGVDLRAYRFEYSMKKFAFMQIARRILSWSDAG
jgi:uncharacterized protein (DUF362 family)